MGCMCSMQVDRRSACGPQSSGMHMPHQQCLARPAPNVLHAHTCVVEHKTRPPRCLAASMIKMHQLHTNAHKATHQCQQSAHRQQAMYLLQYTRCSAATHGTTHSTKHTHAHTEQAFSYYRSPLLNSAATSGRASRSSAARCHLCV